MSHASFNASLRSAQLAYDNTCDCCGHRSEQEPARRAVNPLWRYEYRIRKGRANGSRTYQVPGGGWETFPANRVDPIRQLWSARRFAREPGYWAVLYGELRQRVVSPVLLPADRAPVAQAVAA